MTETYPVSRDPRAAASRFQFRGEVAEIAPHGNGHINDTYRVECHGAGEPARYILQHINRKVFRNPVAVMQNVERVTAHLAAQAAGKPDAARRVLKLVPALDGRNWHVDTPRVTLDATRGTGFHTLTGQTTTASAARAPRI